MPTFLRPGLAPAPRPLSHVRRYPQRYRRLCGDSGKVRWLTELDAIVVVERLGNTGSAYRCARCGYWHITRQPALP